MLLDEQQSLEHQVEILKHELTQADEQARILVHLLESKKIELAEAKLELESCMMINDQLRAEIASLRRQTDGSQ